MYKNNGSFVFRLEAEARGNQQGQCTIGSITKQLADKDREISNLKGMLSQRDAELEQLRPQLQKALQDLDNLRRRLEAEQAARLAAEERLKQLSDKLNFDNSACSQVKLTSTIQWKYFWDCKNS